MDATQSYQVFRFKCYLKRNVIITFVSVLVSRKELEIMLNTYFNSTNKI